MSIPFCEERDTVFALDAVTYGAKTLDSLHPGWARHFRGSESDAMQVTVESRMTRIGKYETTKNLMLAMCSASRINFFSLADAEYLFGFMTPEHPAGKEAEEFYARKLNRFWKNAIHWRLIQIDAE